MHSYWFDDQGNRVRRIHDANDSVTVYEYNVRNRLTTVTDYASSSDADLKQNPTQVVDHVYDLHDRWIGKQVDADGDGDVDVAERYVYANGQIVYRFVDEDADDVAEGTELANRYLWGAAVDQLLAQEDVDDLLSADVEDVLWALTDNLGTIRDLAHLDAGPDATFGTSDDVAHVVRHAKYEAFGRTITITNPQGGAPADTLFGFTGRIYESYTGLQQNHHRWYDFDTGQWMTADPVEDDRENTYRYVGNNPTNMVDPDGLMEVAAGTSVAYTYVDGRLIKITNPGTPYETWAPAERMEVENAADVPIEDQLARIEAKSHAHDAAFAATAAAVSAGSAAFAAAEYEQFYAGLGAGRGGAVLPSALTSAANAVRGVGEGFNQWQASRPSTNTGGLNPWNFSTQYAATLLTDYTGTLAAVIDAPTTVRSGAYATHEHFAATWRVGAEHGIITGGHQFFGSIGMVEGFANVDLSAQNSHGGYDTVGDWLARTEASAQGTLAYATMAMPSAAKGHQAARWLSRLDAVNNSRFLRRVAVQDVRSLSYELWLDEGGSVRMGGWSDDWPGVSGSVGRALARRQGIVKIAGGQVRGFRNAGEVSERAGNLANRLRDAGFDDVQVGIRGSSVSGLSRKGGGFRQLGKSRSDVDFFISSKRLEAHIDRLGGGRDLFVNGRLRPELMGRIRPDIQTILESFGTQTTRQLGRNADALLLRRNLVDTFSPAEALLLK